MRSGVGSKAMIRAAFRKPGSELRELEVEKGASLRQVQKLLCSVFAERFPCMKAEVVVGGKRFDSFMDQPFLKKLKTRGPSSRSNSSYLSR